MVPRGKQFEHRPKSGFVFVVMFRKTENEAKKTGIVSFKKVGTKDVSGVERAKTNEGLI